MKAPFDIAADLDTPVSAYLKLAPFRPRFLLESVEGGERLARYSFIGFGECLEVSSMQRAFASATSARRGPEPARAPERVARRARTGSAAAAADSGVPLSGGLVGYTAYDAVRYFERLPRRT